MVTARTKDSRFIHTQWPGAPALCMKAQPANTARAQLSTPAFWPCTRPPRAAANAWSSAAHRQPQARLSASRSLPAAGKSQCPRRNGLSHGRPFAVRHAAEGARSAARDSAREATQSRPAGVNL